MRLYLIFFFVMMMVTWKISASVAEQVTEAQERQMSRIELALKNIE